jgi:hypothetical protein
LRIAANSKRKTELNLYCFLHGFHIVNGQVTKQTL